MAVYYHQLNMDNSYTHNYQPVVVGQGNLGQAASRLEDNYQLNNPGQAGSQAEEKYQPNSSGQGSKGSNYGKPGSNYGQPGSNHGQAGSNDGQPGRNYGQPGSNYIQPGSHPESNYQRNNQRQPGSYPEGNIRQSNLGQGGRAKLVEQQRQYLQSRFNIQHPQLQCPSSHQMAFLCSNSNCEATALFCDNSSCGNCSKHSQCQKTRLQDVTTSMQNRSKELKPFLYGFFEKQDRLIDTAIERRRVYIDQAFSSGLDRRHTDVIEEIYFNTGKNPDVEGGYADDLEEKLRGSDSFRAQVLQQNPLNWYSGELGRVNSDMEQLERNLLDRLSEKRQVRSLQISKYGYYDITSDMAMLTPQQKRDVSHLEITNTVFLPTLSVSHPRRSRNSSLISEYPKPYPARMRDDIPDAAVSLDPLRSVPPESTQSKYKLIYAGCFTDNAGQMQPFIKEFSQFARISSFTLKVWHEFNDWSCFDDLADVINKKMTHLEWIELYVNKESAKDHHINWAEKLKKGIKVRIKEFGKGGLQSKILAVR